MFHLRGSADLLLLPGQYPPMTYRLNVTLRNPRSFTEFDKLVLKLMWEFRDLEHQRQSQERRVGDLTRVRDMSHGCNSDPGHALCLEIHPTRGTPWTHNPQTRRAPRDLEHLRIHRAHGYQGRRHSQWNRIDSPEINPSVKSDLCLTPHTRTPQNGSVTSMSELLIKL